MTENWEIIDGGILRLLPKPHAIELLNKTYVLNPSKE